MNKIQATIKAPVSEAEAIKKELWALGVNEISTRSIPYERFVRESRMNYDCVFKQMWEEKSDVVYLDFYFDDSAQGREKAYCIEFNLKQVPLNLRYMATEGE